MRLIISLVQNILALIGVVALIALLMFYQRLSPLMSALEEFDVKASHTYQTMVSRIIETGSAVEASVWKVPVSEDLTPDEVEESMKMIANEHNIKAVGELPLYKQVEAMQGSPYRYVKIFMFCDAQTAARMIDYSDAFAAFLPCRVAMVEDKNQKLWLYAMDMDLMIHGGRQLPDDLYAEALRVKKIMLDIMHRGAEGDF